jgi:hypothetical protein
MSELQNKIIMLNKNNRSLQNLKFMFFIFTSDCKGKLSNAVWDTERILLMNVCLDAMEAVHQINSVQLLISALARVDM